MHPTLTKRVQTIYTMQQVTIPHVKLQSTHITRLVLCKWHAREFMHARCPHTTYRKCQQHDRKPSKHRTICRPSSPRRLRVLPLPRRSKSPSNLIHRSISGTMFEICKLDQPFTSSWQEELHKSYVENSGTVRRIQYTKESCNDRGGGEGGMA